MSYEIHAFIGQQEILSEFDSRPMKPVALPQGMALVPLTPALSNWLKDRYEGGGRPHPGFEMLSESACRLGVDLSRRGAVAYVEAFDFGNTGGQDAIVWESGKVVMERHSCDGLACTPGARPVRVAPACHPINEALQRLGVEKGDRFDEFDALRLGRHRKTERWLE